MPGKKKKTATEKSIASDAAARAQYERERRAQNAAAAASSASASSPASSSPAAASPGAGVDIGSFVDDDGYRLGNLVKRTIKSRAEIKAASIASAAAATAARLAKAATKRAEAALPAPGTRRSPACCSRFPLLALI